MTQQLLNGSKVGSTFEEVGGKAMAKPMGMHPTGNTSSLRQLLESATHAIGL